MKKTQRNSLTPRGRSRLRATALLLIIHTSSFILSPCLLAATNDPTGALQRGLFEEEANRNLDTAIAAYQSVVTQFDQDRKLAATAVFRLGECYRKLGRTNEAVVQYERILREFLDQQTLATFSRQDLGALGAAPAGAAAAGSGAAAAGMVSEEARRLAAQLAGIEKLKNDPEQRARAVLALFPDETLKKMLLNLPDLQAQESKLRDSKKTAWKEQYEELGRYSTAFSPAGFEPQAHSNNLLWDAQWELRKQNSWIAQGVDFILGLQKARLQVLQSAAGAAASGENATSASAAAEPASEQREIQRVQTLLAESPDLINAPGKNGETLLQAAAGKGQLEVCQFLLDHGAAVNSNQPRAISPLHYAAGNGHKAVVDLLLRRGAKADAETENGVTPLHLAALKGYTLAAKALIVAGAPLNVHTRGDVDWNGEDIQYKIGAGCSPLDLSIALGYPQVAELLLDAKADPNAPGYRGVPPLVSAAASGQKATVQLLLDHGADVNAADSSGDTALHLAAKNGNQELLALLLAHKADVNAKDKDGNTPLHLAAQNGHVATIKALLAVKADVNAQNKRGETPLLVAARSQKREAAEALLAAGADPNLVVTADAPDRSQSPLLYAVATGDLALARDLLEHGANPNLVAGNRMVADTQRTDAYRFTSGPTTALSAACDLGNAALVKLLLEHGADPNTRRGDGQTPLLSLVVDKPELLQLLLDHKADVKLANRFGSTPLHAAVSKGNTNSVALLVENGADVNARDGTGSTPLHLAVTERNKDLVEILLAHQADPNLLNLFGQTPLDLTKQQATQPPSGLAMGYLVAPPGQAPPGQVGAPPPKLASPAELADLLRQHGAQDWVPRPGQITVTRRSTGTAYSVFRQGTNALNRFTLLEVIAALPWNGTTPVPFPDFSKVTITRRDPKTGKLTDISMDVAALVASGDCSKDVPLEWGDLVNIPDREHKFNEQWQGLHEDFVESLAKCLERKVTVVVKNQPQPIPLAPQLQMSVPIQVEGNRVENFVISIALHFRLANVLTSSARLFSTSDLTRVKVRRTDPATGQPREWIFNEQTVDPVNDLRVRDGDVIEVPEK